MFRESTYEKHCFDQLPGLQNNRLLAQGVTHTEGKHMVKFGSLRIVVATLHSATSESGTQYNAPNEFDGTGSVMYEMFPLRFGM